MGVANRLRELRTAGKHEQVVTLASEILRNESPWVTVTDERVQVKTRTFVGEHALTPGFDPEDRRDVEAAVERRGTYRLRDPDEGMAGFTFTSGCHHDVVVDDLYRGPDDADAEPVSDAGSAVASNGAGTADGADGATADDGSAVGEPEAGTTEETARPSESTSFLQQAVAAVQNQFRG